MNKCFLLIICIFMVASCSRIEKLSKLNKKEVFIKENYRTTKEGELLVDDRDFEQIQKPIATSRAGVQEKPTSSTDNSQINTMIDGFGNKTETRIFSDHPLLQRLVVRTAVNGQKKVFVYGKNGDVKKLPIDMLDKAMNASANELAKSAGIFMGRDPGNDSYTLALLRTKSAEKTLPPADNKFPVTTNLNEQNQSEKSVPVSSEIPKPNEQSTEETNK